MSKIILKINGIPIAVGSVPVGYVVPSETAILTFITNASVNTFDPAFTAASGTLQWDLGDGSIVNANSFTHTYTNPGNKIVKAYPGTTDGSTAITAMTMDNDDIVGTLDISSLSNLGGIFRVNQNPKLTTILNPTSSQTFTYYYAYQCDLTGTLDLTTLTGIGGEFALNDNPNLTQILFPASSATFEAFLVHRCDLTGTLDISGLTGLGGSVQVRSNPNLTQILNPVSSEEITTYYAYDCDLTGTLDVSGLTGLGGNFRVYSNSNLTQILHPATSEVFTYYYAYGCDLTGTLDLTPLSNLGGEVLLPSNPNLTEILFPDSSQVFSLLGIYSCGLTGTLDVSGLTGLGTSFRYYDNHDLTNVIHPTTSQTFSEYRGSNCDLTGTLDISGLTGLGGTFRVEDNNNLKELVLPDSFNYGFTTFRVDDCSLSQASIDAVFSKLNAYYSSNSPTEDIVINAGVSSPGRNSYPTNGSQNADILSLQSIFDASGYDASITIVEAPLLENLVVYYTLDETSGILASDSLGVHDLSIYNDPSLGEEGVVGTSVLFDDSRDTAIHEDVSSGDFYFTDEFSVAAWVKTTDSNFAGIATVYTGTAGGWGLMTGPSYMNYSAIMQIAYDGGSVTGYGDISINDNIWHHVAAVWNGSTILVYVDGIPDVNPPSLTQTPIYNGKLAIGCRASTTGGYNIINGNIDEVGIWHKALTSKDVSTLYNNGQGLTYPFTEIPNILKTENVLGWYDYTKGVTYDSSNLISQWDDLGPNGNDMTQSNDTYKLHYEEEIGLVSNGSKTMLKTLDASAPFYSFIVMDISVFNDYDYFLTLKSSTSVRTSLISTTHNMYGNSTFMNIINASTGLQILRAFWNGSNSKLQYNTETPNTSVDLGLDDCDQIAIANDNNNAVIIFKEIFIIYDTSLSSADETACYNYLASKYNIT